MCGFLVGVMCAFLGCVMCVFLSLRYVQIFRLCCVRFLGAGSPLRGSPLASLAWLDHPPQRIAEDMGGSPFDLTRILTL